MITSISTQPVPQTSEQMPLPLCEITPETHAVEIKLVYASANNVTGRPIYQRSGCFLHPLATSYLGRAVELAAAIGYRLKILDAFRPTEAQWRLWNHAPDTTYVADPRRGSPHSRGIAIDLTLVDENGRELDMGTGFDDFSPAAHHGSRDVPPIAQHNRMVLLGLMSSAGWDFYSKEWWHYQLFSPQTFPLLTDRAAGTRLMNTSSFCDK